MGSLVFLALLAPPAAAGILCGFFRKRGVLEALTLAGSGLAFLASLWLVVVVGGRGPVSAINEWLYADGLSAYVAAIVSGSTVLVALYSVGYLKRQMERGKVGDRQLWLYYLLLNVFLFTMMVVLVSNNLGILWIGTESTTLATAFLVGFYERESSIEAAWKYVILCSVGIALALFGIILTYFSALHVVPAHGNALNWSTLMASARDLDPAVLKLAFVFILVGFGTKAGLAPMHTWKPDAYSEAPAPISALMAAGLVNVALYCLMRFYALTTHAVGGSFASTLFVVLGLVSMGVAVPFILLQKDFKRLLAYSSVEHVGIIVFAVGLGTPLALFGALLHLLNNALAKILLFLTTANVRMAFNTKIIKRIAGAIRVVPISATFLVVGVFAITGWPPFGVFVSEFTIASASFAGGNYLAGVLFLGFLATVFAGFIYYTARMVMGTAAVERAEFRIPDAESGIPNSGSESRDANKMSLIVLGVIVGALLVLGLYLPEPLRNCIQNAVQVLEGNG